MYQADAKAGKSMVELARLASGVFAFALGSGAVSAAAALSGA